MLYRSWFDRTKIRGHVWVDGLPLQIDAAGPDIRVQSDTGHLQYTGTGRRDYLRMARIIKDSFQLSTSTSPPGSVRWYGSLHDTSDYICYIESTVFSKMMALNPEHGMRLKK